MGSYKIWLEKVNPRKTPEKILDVFSEEEGNTFARV